MKEFQNKPLLAVIYIDDSENIMINVRIRSQIANRTIWKYILNYRNNFKPYMIVRIYWNGIQFESKAIESLNKTKKLKELKMII